MKIQYVLLVCGLALGGSVFAAEKNKDIETGKEPVTKAMKPADDANKPTVKAKKATTTSSAKKKVPKFRAGKALKDSVN